MGDQGDALCWSYQRESLTDQYWIELLIECDRMFVIANDATSSTCP